MKLIELMPRWWSINGSNARLGCSFLCPHCKSVRLGIAFANPLDNAQPVTIVTEDSMPKHISNHLDSNEYDVPPGFLWTRQNESFDTLTLIPSIDASKSGHWHGHVINGEVN